jgi:hypothetical protein
MRCRRPHDGLPGGISIGMLSMVAPPYISEASPPEVRGTLVVLEKFSIVSGIAVAFWTTYSTRFIQSDWSRRLLFLLQMAPAFDLSAGTYLLPFWPRGLTPKDRSKEALQSLWKLRQLPASYPQVKLELLDIQAIPLEISTERHPTLQDESRSSIIQLEIMFMARLLQKRLLEKDPYRCTFDILSTQVIHKSCANRI